MSGAVRGTAGYWTVIARSETLYSTARRLRASSVANSVCLASALCDALSMGSRNSSFTTKSCACACIVLLTGFISWAVDSSCDAVEFYSGGHPFECGP